MIKNIYIYLKNIELETDSGILRKDIHQQRFAQLERATESASEIMRKGAFLFARMKVS